MQTQTNGSSSTPASVLLDRRKLTMSDARLQKKQKMFGYGVLLIPILGTIVAIGLALSTGVSKIAIGLLVVMYALTMLGLTVGYHRLFPTMRFRQVRLLKQSLPFSAPWRLKDTSFTGSATIAAITS